VTGSDIDQIVDILSNDEITVLEQLPRIWKSDDNTFHQKDLEKKKKCWGIDVEAVLKNLANLGLIYKMPTKGCWRTTRDGQWVSHKLHDEANFRRWGFRTIRR